MGLCLWCALPEKGKYVLARSRQHIDVDGIVDVHQAVLAVICLGSFVRRQIALKKHIPVVARICPELGGEHWDIFGLRLCKCSLCCWIHQIRQWGPALARRRLQRKHRKVRKIVVSDSDGNTDFGRCFLRNLGLPRRYYRLLEVSQQLEQTQKK
jgi:hypothetical protein